MAGLLTIAKKELVDHVSDQTFLLAFVILLLAMVNGSFGYVQSAQSWAQSQAASGHTVGEGQIWKTTGEEIPFYVVEPFAAFGVFVAIALSFNSINKEREEGSLRVLLSYPVRRSTVILGKLLGSAVTTALVTVATMTISFSIIMFYLGIPATSDFILRLVTIAGLGMLLLFFYMCIGIAVSIGARDTAVTLIGTLLIISFFRPDVMSTFIVAISGVAYWLGFRYDIPVNILNGGAYSFYDESTRGFWFFSPPEAFRGFSRSMFRFQNQGYYPPVYIPIEYEWLLPRNMDLIEAIAVFTVVAFLCCLVAFWRREIE